MLYGGYLRRAADLARRDGVMGLPSLLSLKTTALVGCGAALIFGLGGLYLGNKLGDAKVDRIINKTLIRNVRVMKKADVISAEVGTKTAQWANGRT